MTILADKLTEAKISKEEIAILRKVVAAPAPAIAAVAIDQVDYFFQFPRKCASNSIKWALYNMPGSTFQSNRVYVEPREVMRSPELERIAVVRNPVARIVSCWRHAIVKMGAEFMRWIGDVRSSPTMTFDEFLEAVARTPDDHPRINYHFRSQWAELVNDVGGKEPDYLLHVETLSEDWRTLCEAKRWQHVELEKLNETKQGAVEYPSLSRKQLEIIAERYDKDFSTFNYTP